MNHGCRLPLALVGLLTAGALQATEVAVCTERGRAVLELADEASPLQVANFLRYVDTGFYTGTVFHRVVPGFVVQGGGIDRQLHARATLAPVANESGNGLTNARGTVAAARLRDPDSATAQFFVNLEDNPALDSGRDAGYTVFARVKEGIAVFDEISRLPTGSAGPFKADVPTPLVAIKSITRLDEAALAALPLDGREAALKTAITAAAEAGNGADALRLIGYYRSLCAADDAEISLLEARLALAADERSRALAILEELLATTDATHPSRDAALALQREAVQVVAGCEPPTQPSMPDASAATLDEMLAAQQQVRQFVVAGETYLACLASVIDDEARTAEERNVAVAEHNRMVSAMEQVAAAFNEQIRLFKARG
jgi:cyclophilin family peptidyl-prolyl cis-trans isomerase